MSVLKVLHTVVLGNEVLRWLIALAVALAVYFALRTLRGFVRRSLPALAERTRMAFDDVLVETLSETHAITFLATAIYLGSLGLAIGARATSLIAHGFVLVLVVQLALWANHALKAVLDRYRRDEALGAGRRTGLAAIGFVGRLVLFTLMFLLVMENLGIHVNTLLAGLGISSLAVALALQNILGDLFASLSIVFDKPFEIFDKPFEIGDFIIVDQKLGTVEHVGLRTTRLRSLTGEQLVFSNNDLIKSRIHNYKRMAERRVVFGFGVTYQTPREHAARIPAMVREIIESQDKVRFDRAHFKAFGASSLDFEVVYWVLEADYTLYMDIQQAINLALMAAFEPLGIEFAFPTQTIFLENGAGAPEPAPVSHSTWAAAPEPGGDEVRGP
ncbi:MAG: mechanosensitive ion channel family protein [Deinococcales bacterium]